MNNLAEIQPEKAQFGHAQTSIKSVTDLDDAFEKLTELNRHDDRARAEAGERNQRTKEILDEALAHSANDREYLEHQIAAYAVNEGVKKMQSLNGTYSQRNVSASLKVADKTALLKYAKDAEWTDAITETVNATKLKSMAGLSITSDGRVVDANGMVLPDGAYDVTPAHTSVSFKTEAE